MVAKLTLISLLVCVSLPDLAQTTPDLAEAVLDRGAPAIRFCESRGYCYTVGYQEYRGEPAFRFHGYAKSDFWGLPKGVGFLYVGRTRIVFEPDDPKYGFDTARAGLSEVNTRKDEVVFLLPQGRYTFSLEGHYKPGTTGDGRGFQIPEVPARRWLAFAISDFSAAELEFHRITSSLQKPSSSAEAILPTAAPVRPTADLKIVSQPGSVQAYVDYRFKGVTSEGEGVLVVENLAPGSHRIRLGLPGYKEWRQEVTLTAGDTLEVAAKLVSAGPAPLTLDEVDEALTNGVPKKRVIALVTQFGVDFALTEEVEQRLRKDGADSDLLLLITKSKK